MRYILNKIYGRSLYDGVLFNLTVHRTSDTLFKS